MSTCNGYEIIHELFYTLFLSLIVLRFVSYVQFPLFRHCPQFEWPWCLNPSVRLMAGAVRLRWGLSSLSCTQSPFQAQAFEGVCLSQGSQPCAASFPVGLGGRGAPDHRLPWSEAQALAVRIYVYLVISERGHLFELSSLLCFLGGERLI